MKTCVAFTVVLLCFLPSGEALKCYTCYGCTSQSSQRCKTLMPGSPIKYNERCLDAHFDGSVDTVDRIEEDVVCLKDYLNVKIGNEIFEATMRASSKTTGGLTLQEMLQSALEEASGSSRYVTPINGLTLLSVCNTDLCNNSTSNGANCQ